MSLILYHAAPSRSSTVRWMLEEIGIRYELRVLNLRTGEGRTPDFLALNPMGKVPTLVHDGVAFSESAAICLYLADAFPEAGLAVPIDDPRRGPFLKWLFFGPSALEPAIIDRAFPRKEEPPTAALGWGSYDAVMDTLAAALKPGPYLLGEQFTAADVVIGSGLRWGLMWKLVPDRPEFADYVGRLSARPAAERARAADAALAEGSRAGGG